MAGPGKVDERQPAGADDVLVRVERRGSRLTLLVVPLVLLGLFVVLASQHLLPRWGNPFGLRTNDRSQPVLLQSIQDLQRFEAASGNFQVVVDLEQDARFLPDAIRGQRTLFVGAGSVDAYVDFSRLSSKGLTVSADRTKAEVTLPRPQLERTALDTKRSYVFAQRRGLLDRVGAFFSSNPGTQKQVYGLAQDKIDQAARESGLGARAEQNTRAMLEGMFRSLGFREVTVKFADAP
jgi:Protein of unknown function (DUF4230)